MGKKVSYDFEDIDGSYVETNRSVRYRIGNRFHLCDIIDIRILEKGTEKLGELDGVEYYIASPVTFAVRGASTTRWATRSSTCPSSRASIWAAMGDE